MGLYGGAIGQGLSEGLQAIAALNQLNTQNQILKQQLARMEHAR